MGRSTGSRIVARPAFPDKSSGIWGSLPGHSCGGSAAFQTASLLGPVSRTTRDVDRALDPLRLMHKFQLLHAPFTFFEGLTGMGSTCPALKRRELRAGAVAPPGLTREGA